MLEVLGKTVSSRKIRLGGLLNWGRGGRVSAKEKKKTCLSLFTSASCIIRGKWKVEWLWRGVGKSGRGNPGCSTCA